MRRKGNVIVLIAMLMPVLAGMGAFAIDVGYITYLRSQVQAGADAAALAALEEVPSDQETLDSVALQYAVFNSSSADLEVTFEVGTWNGATATLTPTSMEDADAVRVNILQPFAGLFFGHLLGASSASVGASATAMFDYGISGFEVSDDGPPCSLMPFAVDIDAWNALGAGSDDWTYDYDARTVTPGADGTREFNMFPANGTTPGNFGTVDIGNHNNATPDLERQILWGPSVEDFARHGGRLELDEEHETLLLNGDCGISAAIKDELDTIKETGVPRSVMLYDQVTGNGNNTYYRVVGFAGITIVDVNLTGNNKRVTVQPTDVTDSTVLLGDRGQNDYVRHPPQLVH
jgi:Flp pilus assembly protein TadG